MCNRNIVNLKTAVLEIADSVSCERKTDYCNCRADNSRRHELIYPVNANCFNNDSNNNINKSGKNRTDYKTGKPFCH